jgi:hypothetical protein
MSMSVYGISGSLAPQAMSGASAKAPPSGKMASVFSQVTTPGSGVITKDQFAIAFNTMNPPQAFRNMGVDAVFARLDPQNTGAVSRQNFITGMTQLMAQLGAA